MDSTQRPLLVVMGVSGVGKSTVAAALADRLGVEFLEGDRLHPAANVAKMRAGIPLTDDDRLPWLDLVHDWLAGRGGRGGVATCSALRRTYRDRLRAGIPGLRFVHLTAEESLVDERLHARAGHFMPPALLASQYGVLEPLAPDEPGVLVASTGTRDEVVARALDALDGRSS